MVQMYETHHEAGLEILVLTSSLPAPLPLDRESAELFYAGTDFDWALDSTGWGYEWASPNGSMIVDLESMAVTSVSQGWDAGAVEQAINPLLGISEDE